LQLTLSSDSSDLLKKSKVYSCQYTLKTGASQILIFISFYVCWLNYLAFIPTLNISYVYPAARWTMAIKLQASERNESPEIQCTEVSSVG